MARAECFSQTGKSPVTTRWIDINKGDDVHIEYRSRLVAQELKKLSWADDLFAATPPLEAKKILFDAINKNLDSTFDVIKKELDGYSKKPEYNQVLQKLVDYSKKVLAKELVVHCREEDKQFFKSGVKVGSTIQTLGGFIAENKEGTKEIDLTFEELLRSSEDEIKNTILEKIL